MERRQRRTCPWLQADSDGDGYISCLQALLALRTIVPAELLSHEEEIYIYRVCFSLRICRQNNGVLIHPLAPLPSQILEMVDFRVADGLVDLRLFAVISSLAQKIASME